jgi:hypothetical protein
MELLPDVCPIGRLSLIKFDGMKSGPKTSFSPTLNAISQEEEYNYQRNGKNKDRGLLQKFVGHRCKALVYCGGKQSLVIWCFLKFGYLPRSK